MILSFQPPTRGAGRRRMGVKYRIIEKEPKMKPIVSPTQPVLSVSRSISGKAARTPHHGAHLHYAGSATGKNPDSDNEKQER
jgi:hypothetical protein